MHDLKLTPTESGTKTGTNTSRGVWCGDIFEKCDFVKVSNSNYLQAERSSRWSGWRDLNSRHPAPKAGALPDCATPRKS